MLPYNIDTKSTHRGSNPDPESGSLVYSHYTIDAKVRRGQDSNLQLSFPST